MIRKYVFKQGKGRTIHHLELLEHEHVSCFVSKFSLSLQSWPALGPAVWSRSTRPPRFDGLVLPPLQPLLCDDLGDVSISQCVNDVSLPRMMLPKKTKVPQILRDLN